jgi:glycerol-3-phosphate dehydrogenase subunit C
MLSSQLTTDQCIKCNICTSACPVAAVTELFPGPKVVGPQAQRFREPGVISLDRSVDYCSGCGVCSLVCPHGVQVTEMNILAKAALAERDGVSRRNRLLGRSELVGKIGSWFAPFSNWPLQNKFLRLLAERWFGMSRHAPFPKFARRNFRSWFNRSPAARDAAGIYKVVYFHGCSTNYYEPRVGQAAVAVLRLNGCKVSVAEQNCCGLPLQSNGELDAARAYAEANLLQLAPYVREGYVIVGTSTSCTLALKHEYRAVLGLQSEEAELIAGATYDFFEFLQKLEAEGRLKTGFRHAPERISYHAPCQLRSHGIGRPAADLLRRIPGLTVLETEADCCGVAGTYGLKAEKYQIAKDVGRKAFHEIQQAQAARIACDSETCRWWLSQHTGLAAVHPVEILAEAYGLPKNR